MLALVLSIYLNANCSVCGGTHLDAVIQTTDGISTVHDSEDAYPGDLYVVTTDHDDEFHSDYYYHFEEYMRSVFED